MSNKQKYFATPDFFLGKSVTCVYNSLKRIHDKDAVCLRTLHRWKERFKKEKDVEAKQQTGRPPVKRSRNIVFK